MGGALGVLVISAVLSVGTSVGAGHVGTLVRKVGLRTVTM